ncbi:MAG: peptidase M1 [Spirosomaceae bacterium]|nr:peptidase M1 [Spirosomataceae bacterium]
MRIRLLILLLLVTSFSIAQLPEYQGSTKKTWDLIHTTLYVSPNWANEQLNGKAILTLKPHFYPQNEVTLDAKGFDVKAVTYNSKSIEFSYDGSKLSVPFSVTFTRNDTVSIAIEYVAKPNELKVGGSEAILQDKGLYFVDATTPKKQLWTQGETQANSCWFPTFDAPNEKHTQDIYLRVDASLITLSNGELIEKITHDDNTRTDHWQMKKPHAVYLTMIAAGNFVKTVEPNFKDFEVSYYLEPEFAENALAIFGRTPQMISYFENLLGVKYPWEKYSQIAVREFVSGAMENTTATIHGDFVVKNPNQLVDNNDDAVIAHELFHHWFGDLVTTESWSNLPLNESFADYSEYLWASHFYGEEAGEWTAIQAMENYLAEAKNKQEPLIRFYYNDREDMFDSHSYAKGGRVLQMLRRYVGDEAFFASLHVYLKNNAFKNAEIHNLRMAFEEVTGEDLNWFFNQWFLTAGHARLDVEDYYKKGTLTIEIDQVVDSVNATIYRLPLEVLIGFEDGKTVSRKIDLTKEGQVFNFTMDKAPTFVLIDPKGELVGEINHPKSNGVLMSQYRNSSTVSGRLKALEALTFAPETDELYAKPPLTDPEVRKLVLEATRDSFWGLRDFAVQQLFDYDGEGFLDVEKELQFVIKNDKNANVRADAILAMKNFLNPQNDILFRAALRDTSYAVRGAALEALLVNKPPDAAELVAAFEQIKDVNIFASVASFYAEQADPERLSWFIKRLSEQGNTELYQVMGIFGTYLIQSNTEIQLAALPFLKDMALNKPQWYLRYAAAQSMLLISDLPETQAALKEVIKAETDERLKEAYANY